MLVLDKTTGSIEHKNYSDIVNYVEAGDVVVLNNTRVLKARLTAVNSDSKERELLLLEQHGHDFGIHSHKVLYRGKIHAGEVLVVHGHDVTVVSVEDGGLATIESPENLLELAERFGAVPLPPYMKRDATQEDTERYQTVFAKHSGSVAAPTASLNFTDDLAARLKAKGVHVVYLTLHVGLGTFLPIRVNDITKHQMHSEYFEIPVETAKVIRTAKQNGKKIVAVGTTVARTLEYSANELLKDHADNLVGEADIFIYPSYVFKITDILLTNFHAPRTTVLMLAASLAGWDNLLTAYETAIKHQYSFLSYGDSMLIY